MTFSFIVHQQTCPTGISELFIDYYRPTMKLHEGNVFSRVFHSVRGRQVDPGQGPDTLYVQDRGSSAPLYRALLLPLPDMFQLVHNEEWTVGKWVIGIQLKCLLVRTTKTSERNTADYHFISSSHVKYQCNFETKANTDFSHAARISLLPKMMSKNSAFHAIKYQLTPIYIIYLHGRCKYIVFKIVFSYSNTWKIFTNICVSKNITDR